MTKTFDVIHTVANWGAATSLGAMIVAVAAQVFARLFLDNAPPWTEEASRFFFLYMVGFGLAHGTRSRSLIRLDLFGHLEHRRPTQLLRAAIDLATALLSIFLCPYAWDFTMNGAFERSPSMGISMSVAFFSVLLMFASVFIFSIESCIERLRLAFRK